MADETQVGSVFYDLELKDDKFKAGMGSASGSIKDLGQQFQGLGKQATAMFLGLAGIATVSQSFNTLKGIVVDSTTKWQAYDNSVRMLADSLASTKQLTDANLQSLVNYASQRQKTTVFDDDATIKTGALATQYGLTVAQARRLISVSQNLASVQSGANATGEQAVGIAEALTRAWSTGATRALREFNIRLTDAQTKEIDAADAGDRFNKIMDAMSFSNGRAEEAGKTNTAQIVEQKHAIDDMEKGLGMVTTTMEVDLIHALDIAAGGMDGMGASVFQLSKFLGGLVIDAMQVVNALNAVKDAAMWAPKQAAGFIGNALGTVGGSILTLPGDARNAKTLQDLINRTTDPNRKNKLEQELSQIGGENKYSGFSMSDPLKSVNAAADRASALERERAKIQGLNFKDYLSQVAADSAAGGGVGKAGAPNYYQNSDNTANGKKTADEYKKNMDEMTKKVTEFRRKEQDWNQKQLDAIKKEKTSLADLRTEYDKTVSTINKSIQQLSDAFSRDEASSKESFLTSLASSVDTAKQTIADRNAQIITEQNKGEGADQGLIAKLQAQNAADQAILDSHKDLIEQATKQEEDAKTAIGVQSVIDRFNQERDLARQNYDSEMSDLRQQLADKQSEYKKNQAAIKADTKQSLQDIAVDYTRTFTDLQSELVALGTSFVGLLQLVKAPLGLSTKDVSAALAQIGKDIKPHAGGGDFFPGDRILVGEQGPEILNIGNVGGSVTPSNKVGNNLTIQNINLSEKIDIDYFLKMVDDYFTGKGTRAGFGLSN